MKNRMIEELVKQGISKYRIAKECGVTWNTVQAWYRGFYEPSLIPGTKLVSFYNRIKEENSKI